MTDMQETINGLTQELRRGTIIIGVLSQLAEPQYGYSLVTVLQGKGFSIDAGTLYPLLRRLEKQGLLESRWDTDQTRPRKYYLLSPMGRTVYVQLCEEWRSMSVSLESLIRGGDGDGDH
ncbi:PadR family transcriptional regulator [Paenibacillus tarimensis]|uniref:PadR family transcriptional regulator n=1 Tax=Paenibacillus tarimensis TaxID=416012 RepID=UPI001F3466EC|nr:PadR family transcriptional regulator [Paenibacillus tarimensis]MCF2944085.1 PadR family transcriptional regulator [Paenibacillus tarimensis]